MKVYFHALCPVIDGDINVKLDGEGLEGKTAPATLSCPACGGEHRAKQITRHAYKRFTAKESTCARCGEDIRLLYDRGWVHYDDILSLLDPGWGDPSCRWGGGMAEPIEE